MNQQWFEDNIDPPIVSLVIKLNKVVRTTWSCGGHISDGLLYHNGFKMIIDSEQFFKKLSTLLKRFKFVLLYPLPGLINNQTLYYLQVDSLSFPREWKEDKVKEYYNETYGRLHSAMEKLVDTFEE